MFKRNILLIIVFFGVLILLTGCPPTFEPPAGFTGDDFETGNFLKNPWELGENVEPEIETEEVYQGSYAVRFGDINSNEESVLEIYIDIEEGSKIRFYRKTSSQLGYDHLQFYVDDNFAGEWSGDIGWHEVIRELPSGKHTLKWVYEKNHSVDEYQDSAWIDNIEVSKDIELGEVINVSDSTLKSSILYYIGKNTEAAEQLTETQMSFAYKDLGYDDGKIYRNEVLDFVEFEPVILGIANIDGIENLESLRFLNLNSNNISDLSPLENLSDLRKLYLRYNEIDDISPLGLLNNLTDLGLGNNSINDLTPLSNLEDLKYLYLAYNSVDDISPLQTLTELEEIYLLSNNVSDITALENKSELTWVNLCNNEVEDISSLSSATKLEGLDIGGNEISDISIVQNFTELWYLSILGNQIEDLEPIHDLTDIITLYIGNNPLEKEELNFLQNWNWLRNLNLSSLGLESNDVNFLEDFSVLRNLYLSSNKITSIEFLLELALLKTVYLNDNQICDIQPLVDNTGIGSGDYIDISYNHLNMKPNSDDMDNINTLINRNVDVIYEPQKNVVLTLEIEGNGEVYINETLTPEGTYTFVPGTYLEGRAEPAAGWDFSHWVLNDSQIVYINPADQELWEDLKVKAVFEEE
jgi:Leucine-rich repeat (LRR) protein